MSAQHTPGPWVLEPFGTGRLADVAVDGHLACMLHSFHKNATEEDEANARLIAAAPDLLAALQSLVDMDVSYQRGPRVEEAVNKARYAIAKATGCTA